MSRASEIIKSIEEKTIRDIQKEKVITIRPHVKDKKLFVGDTVADQEALRSFIRSGSFKVSDYDKVLDKVSKAGYTLEVLD